MFGTDPNVLIGVASLPIPKYSLDPSSARRTVARGRDIELITLTIESRFQV